MKGSVHETDTQTHVHTHTHTHTHTAVNTAVGSALGCPHSSPSSCDHARRLCDPRRNSESACVQTPGASLHILSRRNEGAVHVACRPWTGRAEDTRRCGQARARARRQGRAPSRAGTRSLFLSLSLTHSFLTFFLVSRALTAPSRMATLHTRNFVTASRHSSSAPY